MTQPTVEDVLSMRCVSESVPLELARRWMQSNRQQDARRLLEELFKRFSHSIEIGQQLALAYLETGDRANATRVLDRLDVLCRNPQEEVLVRRGRLMRDAADKHLERDAHRSEAAAATPALECYRQAHKMYLAAWNVRSGHYPGINVATLHLLIASLVREPTERDSQLAMCSHMAKTLLSCRAQWVSEHADDAVWHAATAGEAFLLQQDWNAAADAYQSAQRLPQFLPGHNKSMRGQVVRILEAFQRLGIEPEGDFIDLERLLPS